MAAKSFLSTDEHSKCISCWNILQFRFFVGLLLFLYLVIILVLDALRGNFTLPQSSFPPPRTNVYQAVNLDSTSVEVVILGNDTLEAHPRESNCTYWDCVDVYKCGKGPHDSIAIYIYPIKDYQTENGISISQFSKEFCMILDTIKRSKYYTPNPEEACVFVPSIDTLNQHRFSSKYVSQVLQSLPFWNHGENHLIFNMLPGSAPDYNSVMDLNTSRAIIAGAGFSTWTFRYNFDVSIPVYSPVAEKIDSTQPKQKKYLIVSTQLNIPHKYLEELQNITTSSNNLLLLNRCKTNKTDYSKRCECKMGREFDYPNVLKDGMFCLVIKSARLTQAILMDILASQCIPIVIADFVVMPFHSHIDWNKLAVFIAENNIRNLVKIVHSVSKERRGELFWHLRWAFDRYFASIEKITLTALEIINERVSGLASRTYEEWNMPEHLYGPANPLFLPVTTSKTAGFTAVILTYIRIESLFKLVTKLVQTPSLAKILVVWNNQKKAPPPLSEWPVINKPLKVIRTTENKLSNRFFPYDEIETECQLNIDDDILMLTPDELEFGFDVWREFPDRIVGFPARLHLWHNTTKSWRYFHSSTNQASMVLTGAAFHHKIWSWYYTYKMPQEIRNWVDDNSNCEDIAMNFLVANITRKPPIKVTPRMKFDCAQCTNTGKISGRRGHLSKRSSCIRRFAKVYGNMALRTVEFMANPLQYRNTGSGVRLAYPEVGEVTTPLITADELDYVQIVLERTEERWQRVALRLHQRLNLPEPHPQIPAVLATLFT